MTYNRLVSIFLAIILILLAILIAFLFFSIFLSENSFFKKSKTFEKSLELKESKVVADSEKQINNSFSLLPTYVSDSSLKETEDYENFGVSNGGLSRDNNPECKKDSDCKEDSYSNNYCYLSNSYRKVYEYSCEKGKCVKDTNRELVEKCSLGCDTSNGKCIRTCYKNSDCGNDQFKGEKYCKDGKVYDDFKKYTCANPGTASSECKAEIVPTVIENCSNACLNATCVDCTNDGNCCKDYYKEKYCLNGDIYRDLIDFYCAENNKCQFVVKPELVESCSYKKDCFNASCISITCEVDTDCDDKNIFTKDICMFPGTKDSACTHDNIKCFNSNDCGQDGFAGNKYCKDTNVFQDFKKWTCLNPGTSESNCIFDLKSELVQQCCSSQTCSNGVCIGVCVDNDKDGYDNCAPGTPTDDGKAIDCNDNDNKVYPGAPEICDNKDNDCDGSVDENNGNCASGQVCSNGQCVSKTCTSSNDCNAGEFCDFPLGQCIGNGICVKSLELCPTLYDPVCGCNGVTYSNDCVRMSNKISKKNNGECAQIKCSKDSDCGTNDFVGTAFCQDNDLYRGFASYKCLNSGTSNSQCSFNIFNKKIEECAYGCKNNKCASENCSDSIDNDGDGGVDGLTNLDLNGEAKSFGSYDTLDIVRTVTNAIRDKKFSITPPKQPILAATGGTGGGNKWNDDATPQTETLNKVCKILGYGNYSSYTCYDDERSGNYPNGKCYWHSPEDNKISTLLGDNFVTTKAGNKYSHRWLATILCQNRLPACSDGWDNDNDGKIDSADSGCASPNDDSEIQHDSECVL